MTEKIFSSYTDLTTEQVITTLKTSVNGLDQQEADKRLHQYGPNEIPEKKGTLLEILKNQITNPFFYIFVIIASSYLLIQQFTESVIIFLIIGINVTIGFYQEYSSSQAMKLLKKYLVTQTKVKRSNQEIVVPTNLLVPGDIVVLEAGDIIPADCRVIHSDNITIDESNVTGESLPVKKTASAKKATEVFSAENICFTGTTVIEGTGEAVIFSTGKSTLFGEISFLTTQTISKSNLASNTTRLARILLYLIFISLITTLLINVLLKKGQMDMVKFFLFCAALAISAIPEALPAVITFCLAQGAAKLKKHNVIVKRLSAIEDLGSVEILCTDKTGTLTENILSVNELFSSNPDQTLLYTALSMPTLLKNRKKDEKGFELAIDKKLTATQKEELKQYKLIHEIPFTPQTRRNSVLLEKNNAHILITKGSFEPVISKCMSVTDKTQLISWIEKEETEGNRVLAIASKEVIFDQSEPGQFIENNDHSYTLLGLLSFHDTLKKTAPAAVAKAHALGLKLKILSGDSKFVCYSIAKQLGLEDDMDNVVTGSDFENSSDEQKSILAHNATVFARFNPEQKYDVISILQRKFSVGYLGDGINDAPALKLATVSLAVNDSTPIAREAADIILLKKSLMTIIVGIEEGRKIVINTLKYIRITISSNYGNFYSLSIASLLIDYLPMLPFQLLLLNLLTDLPLITISTDAVSSAELRKVTKYELKEISLVSFIFGTISSFFDFLLFFTFRFSPQLLQTVWFVMCTLKEMALIFSLRTTTLFYKAKRPSIPLVSLALCVVLIAITLPFTKIGRDFFLFSSLHVTHLFYIGLIVVTYFMATEGVKNLYYFAKNHNNKVTRM